MAVFAFIALAFAGGFLFIVINKGTNIRAPAPKPVAVLTSFNGKLAVQSIDDLRVGDRKIVLRGVALPSPLNARNGHRGRAPGLSRTCLDMQIRRLGDTVRRQCRAEIP